MSEPGQLVRAPSQGSQGLNMRLSDMGELEKNLVSTFNLPFTLTTSKNFRNLEHLLLAAQQQQLRQLRRLQQLKKQTEIQSAQQAAWEAKEQAEQLRKEMREMELAEESARKAAKVSEAESRRKAAQEAAERQQEEYRKRLEEKLSKTKPRLDTALLEYERRVSAAKSAARMQRTQARKEQVQEERRTAILAAEAAAERRLQQKHELRLLQEAIKREEDSLAEEHRREIQARAEADEAAKVAYYEAKQRLREQRLQQRHQEAEELRSLRAEESRARFEYIRSRADAANEQDMVKREELERRLQEKLRRAEALASERETLTTHLRRTLEQQDLRVKQVFDRMAATGKLELPTELLITLSTLENVVTSPYLTAECSPRGGLTSPRGGSYLASPCGGAYLASPPSLPCSPALPQGQACSSSMAGSGSQRASSPGRSTSPNRASSPVLTPRRLLPDVPPPAGLSPRDIAVLQRQQEAALQRVLEEEILKEMNRENMLQAVVDVEERKRLMRQFAAEREAAKARILQVGNQLLTQTKPASAGGASVRTMGSAAGTSNSP